MASPTAQDLACTIMLSEHPVHVFPFSDPTSRVYCGNWYEGDGWTVLPDQVTCIECMKRAVAIAVGTRHDVTQLSTHPVSNPSSQPFGF